MRSVFSREDVYSGLLIAASVGLGIWAAVSAGTLMLTRLLAPVLEALR